MNYLLGIIVPILKTSLCTVQVSKSESYVHVTPDTQNMSLYQDLLRLLPSLNDPTYRHLAE